MAKKIKVQMTQEQLAAMSDWGQALWATPGASAPYWNSNASFTYDECVATPDDFEWQGIPFNRDPDGWEGDEVFEAEVELLDPLESSG